MEVGLVAHILGWSREGVLVLQLYDTVGYFDKSRAADKCRNVKLTWFRAR